MNQMRAGMRPPLANSSRREITGAHRSGGGREGRRRKDGFFFFQRINHAEDLLITWNVQWGSPFARQVISTTEYCLA
jgi:hypothetical protein